MSGIPQVTVATVQTPGLTPPQAQVISADPLALANTPDFVLEHIANGEAYQNFNEKTSTKAINEAGKGIPLFHSVGRGVLHKGSAASKFAKTAKTGSDWGLFVAFAWIYGKTLGKVYETFPTLRKVREENPATFAIGETFSAAYVATKGKNFVQNKIDKKLVEKYGVPQEQVWNEFFDRTLNRLGKTNEVLNKACTHVDAFVAKNKTAINFTKNAGLLGLGGLLGKYFYDVHKTKKNADKRLEELKDQRYQIALNLANQSAKEIARA